MSFQGAKMPSAPVGGSALLKVGLLGGAGLYAVLNSFYNVEGGHRAIVFNRIQGIKDKVWRPRPTRFLARPPLSAIRCAVGCWFGWKRFGWVGLRGAIGREMWLQALC